MKIKQDLEADFMAKVNTKVKENMSWMFKKLGENNPGLKFDMKELCATASSDYDDNDTPTTQGGTEQQYNPGPKFDMKEFRTFKIQT